jgi:hypothetical protein
MIICRDSGVVRRSRLGGALVFASLLLAQTASAHNGPPFPILVDQKIDPYVISVWADPNVGAASTFFVIVNPPAGGSIPNDLKVDIGVQPVNGRLSEAFYPGEREDLRGQIQYKALVQFDAQEFWRVRVRLQSAQGSGEVMTTVEATPVGYGRWDMLLYLLPFVGVGVLWFLAVARKRIRRAQPGRSANEMP